MDLAPILAGSQHDLADKRAQRPCRFAAAIRIIERLGERLIVVAV